MSDLGNRSLVASLRDRLSAAIKERTIILINKTTEREAGFIQGLQTALEIVNDEIRIIQDEDRPSNRKSN